VVSDTRYVAVRTIFDLHRPHPRSEKARGGVLMHPHDSSLLLLFIYHSSGSPAAGVVSIPHSFVPLRIWK
jgi:hypothetical protein